MVNKLWFNLVNLFYTNFTHGFHKALLIQYFDVNSTSTPVFMLNLSNNIITPEIFIALRHRLFKPKIP